MTRTKSRRQYWLPSWGVRIAIVYTTFAVGTLAWAGYAMSRDVDLVRPDYYEYSLDHDKTMRAEENARALAASASITVDNESVIVQLPAHMASAPGTVTLYRPNSVKQDRTFKLVMDATGAMHISYREMPPGQWDVTVQWKWEGKAYELKQRAMF